MFASRERLRPYESSGPYGMATVIFGLSLLIADSTLGWPKGADVVAIFERNPSV